MHAHRISDAVFDDHLRSEFRSHTGQRLNWLIGSVGLGVFVGVLAVMSGDGAPDSAVSAGVAGFVCGLTGFTIGLRILKPTVPVFDLFDVDGGAEIVHDSRFVAARGQMYATGQLLLRRCAVDTLFVSAGHFVVGLCWIAVAPLAQSALVTIVACVFGVFSVFSAWGTAREARDQWVGPDPAGFFTGAELVDLRVMRGR